MNCVTLLMILILFNVCYTFGFIMKSTRYLSLKNINKFVILNNVSPSIPPSSTVPPLKSLSTRLSLLSSNIVTKLSTLLVTLDNKFDTILTNSIEIFTQDESLLSSIKFIIKNFIGTYITIILLGTLGIDTKSLLLLLATFTLTAGLSVQKLLQNFVIAKWFLILKPIQINDKISIVNSNINGKVLSMNMNYITLNDKFGNDIIIPTSYLYNQPIQINK